MAKLTDAEMTDLLPRLYPRILAKLQSEWLKVRQLSVQGDLDANKVLGRGTLISKGTNIFGAGNTLGNLPTAPPDNGGYLIQAGYLAATTDAGGHISCVFPKPFPRQVIAFVAVTDASVGGNDFIVLNTGASSRLQVTFQVIQSSTGNPRPLFATAISYIAVGY